MRRLPHGSLLASLLAVVAFVVALLPTGFARADSDLAEVPDVAGRPIADAEAALSAAGFIIATVEVEGAPADSVAAQAPAAGALLPRGGLVVVDVRARHEATTAPKATGLTPAAASTAFGALFDLEFQPVPGAPADRGAVVAQVPGMGATLTLRGKLTLSFVPDPTLAPTATVPGAAGLPPAEAIQAVADAGLHARIARVRLPGTPADLVVGQVPTPGTEMPRYGTVVLVVSAASDAPADGIGTAVVAVPNLLGLTESSARAELQAANLDLDVAWVDGPPADAFLVRTQTPDAGASAATGSTVKVEIVQYAPPEPPAADLPPTQVACPELVGLTQGQAEALLASLGLVGNPILEATNDVPPLRVFAQQLVPGTLVNVGTQVAFRIAKPLPPPTATPVPNFYGRTKGDVLVLAAQAGLGLTVLEVVTPSHPPHRVYSQNLAAFSVVPLGTVVTVKLARPPAGPTLVQVPDLDGLHEAQAMAKLASVGFAGHPMAVVTPNHPPFRVYAQQPSAGAPWPVGATVSFKVAKPPLVLKLVPPLLGLTKVQAKAAVLAAGLQPDAQDVVAFNKPPGKVFAQDPVAGQQVPPGTTVSFRVAKTLLVPVPNVIGKLTGQAIAMLEGAGLTPSVKVVVAPGKPPGFVFDQAPNFGALAQPNTVVEIRVPFGAGPQVLVPNLIGMSKAAALALLAAKNLQADVVTAVTPPASWGKVVAQLPGANQAVAVGATVKLKVGVAGPGPQIVLVPNVVGLGKLAAKAALESKGFVVDIDDVVAPAHPLGKVFDQAPNANQLRPVGATVQIRVAKLGLLPPLMVGVPGVVGMTPAQAQQALVSAGLGSQGVAFIVLNKPHGRVWWQETAPGTLVAKGTTIKWRWNP